MTAVFYGKAAVMCFDNNLNHNNLTLQNQCTQWNMTR